MSLVNAYTTVEDLRTRMGDAGSTADTTELENAINSASRAIDDYTGRRFWLDSAVTTRVYRPVDPDMVWVQDIGSTSGLVIETDDDDDGTFETTWDSDDYELQPDNADALGASGYAWWRILAVDDRLFPVLTRRRSLRVTAKHGWSAVPSGVRDACLLLSYTLYKRRESANGYAGMTDFGPARVLRFDPHYGQLLGPYFKHTVGAV